MKKLAAVIAKILDVARHSDGPLRVEYSAAESQLALYKNNSGRMLPDDLYSKWSSTTETKDLAPLKTPGITSDGKDIITVIVEGKQHFTGAVACFALR